MEQRVPIISQTFLNWAHWKQYIADHLMAPLRDRLSTPGLPLPHSERGLINSELAALNIELERPNPMPVE